jgi:hypothetical protein
VRLLFADLFTGFAIIEVEGRIDPRPLAEHGVLEVISVSS